MRSFFKKLLVPCFTLAFSALALQACSGDTNNSSGSSTAGRCVVNDAKACACPGGTMGVQTCGTDGTYSKCDCGTSSSSTSSSSGMGGGGGSGNCHNLPNTPTTCGDGKVDLGEECDDGNCVATDTCNNNCKNPYCGDGVIQPSEGETCEGEVDCSNCGKMTSSSSSSSSSGAPCMGKLIFAGFSPAQIGAFTYGGQIGLDAATAACQAIGAFGMCDYDQWKQMETGAAMHPLDIAKLQMTIPNGTCQDVWLQRTSVAMDPSCPGGMSAPGPGGNCNNWNYPTNHLADGEHVNVCNMGGTITYTYSIDCDTVYDANNPGPHQNQVLTCGTMRPIPCCYEKCIPPKP